jgi:hypothetical protein
VENERSEILNSHLIEEDRLINWNHCVSQYYPVSVYPHATFTIGSVTGVSRLLRPIHMRFLGKARNSHFLRFLCILCTPAIDLPSQRRDLGLVAVRGHQAQFSGEEKRGKPNLDSDPEIIRKFTGS